MDRLTGPLPRRLLYVATEDWFFLSHRLPMARAARDAGFEVHVATNVAEGGAAIAADGFILHPIRFVRGRLAPLAALRTILALRRLYRELRPDLVHHVALQPVVFGGIAAWGLNISCVHALTGLGHTFTSRLPQVRLLRTFLGFALRVVVGRPRAVALVQNPDDRTLLAGLGIPDDRLAVIPGSGVDTAALRPLPEPAGPVTLAFVGRLLTIKGVRDVIAAHRLLRTKGRAPHLLIAGMPDSANPSSIAGDEVESWAREPGITLLGHVPDIATVWARAHIAVLASTGGEGMPKTLLEAAACGRPMVATDVEGCREIVIPGETGLLVPPGDPAALAAAFDELAGDPALRARFGAAARRLAEQRFSADAIGRATVELYFRLLAE